MVSEVSPWQPKAEWSELPFAACFCQHKLSHGFICSRWGTSVFHKKFYVFITVDFLLSLNDSEMKILGMLENHPQTFVGSIPTPQCSGPISFSLLCSGLSKGFPPTWNKPQALTRMTSSAWSGAALPLHLRLLCTAPPWGHSAGTAIPDSGLQTFAWAVLLPCNAFHLEVHRKEALPHFCQGPADLLPHQPGLPWTFYLN